MNHTINYNAKKTFGEFITAYFYEKDISKVLETLHDKINWNGVYINEVAIGVKSVRKIIEENMLKRESFNYSLENFVQTNFSKDLVNYSLFIRNKASLSAMLKADDNGNFKIISININNYTKDREKLLINTESIFNEIIQGGVIGAYLDEDYTFYFINKKLLKYLGYENEEEFKRDINSKCANLIHPEDLENYKLSLKKQLETKKTFSSEFRMKRADQTYIYVSEIGTVLEKDDNGKILSSFILDITSRKKAIFDKKFIEKNTEIALKHTNMNYWIYYFKEDKIRFLNTQKDFDYLDQEFNNYPESLFARRIIHPEDSENYKKVIEKIKNGEKDEVNWKSRVLNGEKEYKRRSCRLLAVYNDLGQREYAVGICGPDEEKLEVSKINGTLFNQMGVFSWVYRIKEKEVETVNSDINLFSKDLTKTTVKNVPERFFQLGFVKGNENIQRIKKFFKEINQGKISSKTTVYLYNAQTGKYGWYQGNMTIIEWEKEEPKTAIGSMYDITDTVLVKKRFEEALKLEKKERKYQLESYVPGAYTSCVWNLSKNILHSQVGYNWLIEKLSVEEQTFDNFLKGIGKNLSDENYRDIFIEEYSIKNLFKFFAEGKNNIIFTLPYNSYIGKIWAKTNLFFIKDPTTDDIFLKITNENKTNKIIKDEILNIIVKNEFNYIAHIDKKSDKCFLIANQEEKICSLKDYMIKFCKELEINYIDADDFFKEVYKILKESGIYEKSYTLKNKKVKLISIHILNEKNKEFCILCSDITELTREEKHQKIKLLEAKKIAEKANTLKSDFFTRMSHDMRTPLNSIISFAEFGIRDGRDARDIEYFSQIKESSNYLLGLLNDILNMRRIEMGKIQINPEPVFAEEFIRNVLNIVKPKAESKKIDLKVRLHTDVWKYQKFDKLRVMQIELNILNNAIKYTKDNGKIIWNKWFKYNEKNEPYFHNEIIDNGVGMSQEFLKKVFEPFAQEKNELSHKEPGSGLGLAITKKLIEMIGGKIWCESELGKGTVFYFNLPVKIISKKEYLEYSKEDVVLNEKVDLTNKKILLCEDNEINARIMIKLLENKGVIVTWVDDGYKGVIKAKEENYDLILMDIRMPVMDGLSATKEIRGFDKNIPIVALSANAYEEDIQKSLDAGMNIHLPKPINFNVLYDTLENIIN
ncbi:MAG: response regulator [Fusobacterium sp. JB020]|nr:response regulator [Fusobacterium sp. JB020]